MNIIRNAKNSANKRSIDNYGRIVETSMVEYQSQYLKYPDSIDQLEIEYVGSVIECETRRINPDKTIYLSECKVNGKKVLDKSTEDGYYHYGTLLLTNEEYVDKLGNNIELALKDYYKENNKYPVNYRLLNLPKLAKDVNCVSHINSNGTVYLTKCSIDGSYILNENEEDGYYHYGEKNIYDYVDSDGNGYIKVDYLESNGNPYIDTGVYPKSTTKLDIKFSLVDYSPSTLYWVNGWGSSGYQESFEWGVYEGKWMLSVSSKSEHTYLDIPIDLERHSIHLESGSQKFDNIEYSKNTIGNTAEENQTLYLFALNAEWSNEVIRHMPERIYSVKIYDDNIIIRDYIPVIDTNDKGCLFDKVEKKCYYNNGTGDFEYKKNYDVLYDYNGNKYKKINYLESNGTQYIDTGIYPKSTTVLDVDYNITNYPQTDSKWVNGWGSSGYQESFEWGVFNGKWMLSASSKTEYTYLDIPVDLEKHSIHLESGSQKFDNVEYATNIIGNTATNNQMIYLFALNAEWSNEVIRYIPQKIYSVKIYEQNSICRNFIPTVDSSNRPCLFDKVEHKCYYNQGTGEFLYG